MHVMFLPGGGGAPEFWQPMGALLPTEWKKTYLSWPGLGKQPKDSSIRNFDDLVALAEKYIHGQTVLIAQSLGGVVGIRLALKHPSKIAKLVLVAASGGVDIERLGGEDWRPAYLSTFPDGDRWITEEKPDHTKDIPNISSPTLLLWGGNDSISPLSVGRHFMSLLPNARLHVVDHGDHYFARDRASELSPLIMEYLNQCDSNRYGDSFNTTLNTHAMRGSA